MNIIFFVGTGRCGSTFVHEIFAKHNQVGFISNIEDNFPINNLGRWNNQIYRSPIGNFTKKGGLRFAPSEAYRLISREVSPIYANSFRDLDNSDVTPWLKKQFNNFFSRRIEAQNLPLFSHKYTGWSRMLFFKEIFPNAKFVHIVRDGRAVANSWLQMPWWSGYRGAENWFWGPLSPESHEEWASSDYAFEVLAAISWKILMNSYNDSATKLPAEDYIELKYEDILETPESAFSKILKFSNLEWNDEYAKSFKKQNIVTSRKRAFESDLNKLQLAKVESTLSKLLDQYQYK